MKIIVVGAGIAGLTMALACQRVGINVKVYEKAKKLEHIGGGVLLWPHGLRYLDWLGLSQHVKPFSLPIKQCYILNEVGEKIFSEEYAHFYSLIGGEILPIDRSLLQQALVEQLQENSLQLNKACVAIQNEQDQATVIFADGTQDSADLIIGADGIHSIVRKSFNEQASPEYTNHCWWGGIVAQKDVPALVPNEVFTAIGLGKMCIAWPTHGECFMWYLPVKMPLEKVIRNGEEWSQLQSLCAGWNPAVEQLIQAPAVGKKFYVPIYALPPQERLSHHRVVLIGDAAHALGPVLGQGASQAIEDVFVLMQCLKDRIGISNILKKYEAFRHGKYKRIALLEDQVAATLINDNEESLALFKQQISQLDLATIYQDLIPLVNENFSQQLSLVLSQMRDKEVCLS